MHFDLGDREDSGGSGRGSGTGGNSEDGDIDGENGDSGTTRKGVGGGGGGGRVGHQVTELDAGEQSSYISPRSTRHNELKMKPRHLGGSESNNQ